MLEQAVFNVEQNLSRALAGPEIVNANARAIEETLTKYGEKFDEFEMRLQTVENIVGNLNATVTQFRQTLALAIAGNRGTGPTQ